jgi:hypothetical protein
LQEQVGEDEPGHAFLVGGEGEAVLGDVERPLRRAAIVLRVVQDAVGDAVRLEQFAGEAVAERRQRQFPRHAGPIEHQGLVGEAQIAAGDAGKVVLEIRLDPHVGGAAGVMQSPRLFAVVLDQLAGRVEQGRVLGAGAARQAGGGELEVYVLPETAESFLGIGPFRDEIGLAIHQRLPKGGVASLANAAIVVPKMRASLGAVGADD